MRGLDGQFRRRFPIYFQEQARSQARQSDSLTGSFLQQQKPQRLVAGSDILGVREQNNAQSLLSPWRGQRGAFPKALGSEVPSGFAINGRSCCVTQNKAVSVLEAPAGHSCRQREKLSEFQDPLRDALSGKLATIWWQTKAWRHGYARVSPAHGEAAALKSLRFPICSQEYLAPTALVMSLTGQDPTLREAWVRTTQL